MKKILTILLCIAMLATICVGCNAKQEEKDWANAYTDYLENVSLGDNVKISMSYEEDNTKGDISISKAGDISLTTVTLPNASLEIYTDHEYMYLHCKALTQELWQKTKIAEGKDAIDFGEAKNRFHTLLKDIKDISYVKEVKENGVTYDVLSAEIPWGDDGVRYYVNEENEVVIGIYENTSYADGSGKEISYESLPATTSLKLYINRKTQELAKAEGFIYGQYTVLDIEHIKELEVPKLAKNAQEVSGEEFSLTILGLFFSSITAE